MADLSDDDRRRFEAWASDDGTWPKAIERDASGQYKLSITAHSWTVWRAAIAADRALNAPQAAPVGEPVILADVLDALNVFNRPKPSEDDGPWEAGHFIRVDYLPAFINIIRAAWFSPTHAAPVAPAEPMTACPHDVPHRWPCAECDSAATHPAGASDTGRA